MKGSGRVVFPTDRRKRKGISRFARAPLVEFRRPSGPCPIEAGRRSRRTPSPSLGFCTLWHIRSARSGLHGLCLPVTFRPQGLATLSTACSLARLAGPVSYRQRLWASPFGAFSSREVARHYCRRTPRLPLLASPAPSRRSAIGLPDSKPGYRVLPLGSPSRSAPVFSRRTAGCSPGFSPSQGTGTSALARTSPRLLPRASSRHRVTPCRVLAPRSFDRPTPRSTRGPSTPLRVSRLNVPGIRRPSPARAMGSPRAPPRIAPRSVGALCADDASTGVVRTAGGRRSDAALQQHVQDSAGI